MACGSTTMVLPATIAIPASPALTAPSTVRGPTVGKIETQILAALRRFHQHAPRRLGADAALAAQPRDPRQQSVGALDVLDPDHVAVDHDGGLADIERAQRAQHVTAPGDVDGGIFIRCISASGIPQASARRGRRP